MSGASEARGAIATAVEAAGYQAFDHVPSVVTPPLVIFYPADPYIEETGTFSNTEMVINLEMLLIVPSGDHDVVMDEMDAMIEAVVLNLGEWIVTGVSAPYVETTTSYEYLTCRVTVSQQFNLLG